ncbi:MAG: rod shape-determining protein MreC [Patescibacteria group bacterium]
MKKGILIGLIIVLTFIVFFTDFFIPKNFLDKPINLLRSFLSQSDVYKENLFLKQEIEDLRAQMQLINIRGNGEEERGKLITKIFSAYPFNIKNTLTLNVGTKQGIKKGMTATFGENILLGQIIDVFEDKSVIRTIFDPKWQLSVRIGQSEIDGLLIGGIEPKITLLEKDKPLQVGDVVYSASSDLPYGLKIGEIAGIKQSSGDVFKEARLKTSYNINDLKEAYVLIF